MCPSCCGGLFSENTKGSVYTKRKSTVRKSETKSVITTIYSEENGTVGNDNSVQLPLEKQDDAPKKNNAENNDICLEKSLTVVVPEDTTATDTTIEKQKQTEEMTANQNNLKLANNKIREQNKRPKLQKDVTIEDNIDMYAKQKQISLTGSISQEFSQNIFNGDVKLRRTSYPTHKVNENKPTQDTIIELKIGGKEYVEVKKQDAEETPFNFQAVLRKTNTNRQSLRRSSEDHIKSNDSHYCVSEILPGVILKGTMYDL